MKRLVVLCVIAICGCQSRQPVIIMEHEHAQKPTQKIVTVYSVAHHDRLVTIYMDENMTVPLANPFISDANGNAVFYAPPQDCCYIVIKRNKNY